MQLSKTKVKIRTKKKKNSELSSTIALALKNKAWFDISKILSGPTRLYSSVNLDEIDSETKVGDTIVIPGKVLSLGNLTKKIRICALSISKHAQEKLVDSKSEFATIAEEIKKNPKGEGIKIIR
jgi:large subunit ribosomal protein L18e